MTEGSNRGVGADATWVQLVGQAGGIAGGLIGAMVGAGIPKERAIVYEKGLQEGHIVIGVHPRNAADAEYIQNEWIKNGVLEIHH